MTAEDLTGRFVELKYELFTCNEDYLLSGDRNNGDFFFHSAGEIFYIESLYSSFDLMFTFNVITQDCKKKILPALYAAILDSYLSII